DLNGLAAEVAKDEVHNGPATTFSRCAEVQRIRSCDIDIHAANGKSELKIFFRSTNTGINGASRTIRPPVVGGNDLAIPGCDALVAFQIVTAGQMGTKARWAIIPIA